MDYKEKYDAALERARKELQEFKNKDCDDTTRRTVINIVRNLFPELLMESEDERIRKGIIRNLQYLMDKSEGFVKEDLQERIAWLEKQKEFVSADFDDVWETADCDELTAPLEKYSKDAIKKMCHAWYDKGIELERRNWLNYNPQPKQCEHLENYDKEERIRKGLIKAVSRIFEGYKLFDTDVTREEALAWLEKQKDYIKFPDSAYTSNRDVIEFADKYSHTVWEKLMDKFKKNENYSIGCNDVSDLVLNAIINIYNWLEKQDKSNPYSGVSFEYNGHIWGMCARDNGVDILLNKQLFKHLEKQGEQTTDKVEPKFKVGDWVVKQNGESFWNGDCVAQITNITGCGEHWFDSGTWLKAEDIRLWTINDAKDGDVLAYVTDEEDLWIMIYRSLYEPYEGHVHYHALLVNDDFSDKGTCCICIDNLKPATKEQRDLLFEKMRESGYELDKELIK